MTRFLLLPLLWIATVGTTEEAQPVMVIQRNHTDLITCAAYDRQGSFFATGSDDRTIKLWDANGRLVRNLAGHHGPITSVSFSPDGSLVLSSSSDGTARLWKTEDGSSTVIPADTSGVFSACLDAAGQSVFTLSHEIPESSDLQVKKWRLDGSFVAGARIGSYGSAMGKLQIVFTPSNTIAMTLGSVVMLLDSQTLTETGSFPCSPIYFNQTGSCFFAWSESDKDAVEIRSSRDGSLITTIRAEMTLTFQAAELGGSLVVLSNSVESGGRSLLRCQDLKTGTVLWQITPVENGYADVIRAAPDGESMLLAGGMGLQLVAHDGKTLSVIPMEIFMQSRLAVHPSGDVIALLQKYYRRECIQIWGRDGRLIRTIEKAESPYSYLAWSSDGAYLASYEGDGTSLWTVEGDRLATLPGLCLAMTRDGRMAFPADRRKGERGLALKSPDGSTSGFLPFSIGEDGFMSADGRYLISKSSDSMVTVYDVQSGATVTRIQTPLDPCRAIADVPSSGLLLTAGSDREVPYLEDNCLWLYDLGGALKATMYHSRVTCVAASPDGKILASGADDNTIRIWSSDARLLRILTGHSGAIENLAFTPDGRFLVSNSRDTSLRIWNIETGDCVAFLENGGEWMIYTEDGYFDCSPGGGKLVGMTAGRASFGIDQFSTMKNRPDLILGRLGAGSKAAVDNFYLQYVRRLARHNVIPDTIPKAVFEKEIVPKLAAKTDREFWGSSYSLKGDVYRLVKPPSLVDKLRLLAFRPYCALVEKNISSGTHVPRAAITAAAQDGKLAELSIELEDARYSLVSYHVFINDVPLFGTGGKRIDGKRVAVRERVELTSGVNKVEVSCVNERLAESYRALRILSCDAAAKGDLYYLGFGVSSYRDASIALLYPHKDIADLAAVLTGMRGSFNAVHSHAFVNERCTVENIRTAKSLLAHATPDDTVVLFISGHGMHASDAEARYYFLPWEVNIEDIAGTACPFEAVEDILDGIRPRQKLFLMDTCESGELDEEIASGFLQRASAKGIRAKAIGAGALAARGGDRGAPERAFLLERNRYIYTDLFRRTGAVVFSSSRGYEFSYEPITFSEKENGFFTAAVLQALKGTTADGDKDGIVFLDELEAFVRRTVSARSDGLQNPTVDRDNISIRFGFPAGSGN